MEIRYYLNLSKVAQRTNPPKKEIMNIVIEWRTHALYCSYWIHQYFLL